MPLDDATPSGGRPIYVEVDVEQRFQVGIRPPGLLATFAYGIAAGAGLTIGVVLILAGIEAARTLTKWIMG